ncbi:MAG: Ig-like domain-containing protein [Anaerolineae bacterium]
MQKHAAGRSALFGIAAAAIVVLTGCNLTDNHSQGAANRPTIEFLYPSDNTSVLSGTDVQIELVARDEQGPGVARVELTIDDLPHQEGAPVERDQVQVFTVMMNWLAEGSGLHQMTAIAYRLDGTASTPVTIRVTVIEPMTPTGQQ